MISTLQSEVSVGFIGLSGFKIGGQEFKRGAAIICNLDPIEVTITLITNSTTVIFSGRCYKVAGFESHFKVYVLSQSNSEKLIMYNKLPIPIPLHPRVCQTCMSKFTKLKL